MKVVVVLCLLCALCDGLKLDFKTSKILQLQGQTAVKNFLQSSQVRVLYLYKKDVKYINFFFKELGKSAEFLELYGVKIGFCNCTEELSNDVEDCKTDGVENSVHTYRSGSLLLSLELETMFDVNSIMSNILQLVMLREVPILQTVKEVQKFLESMRGKKDVVFGHMKAIGTSDHRVFMEVAYAYVGKLQFVVCTDKKATQLFEQPKPKGKDFSTVWWVWTKPMSTSDSSYHNVRYKKNIDLKSLAKFASTIIKPKMFDIPSDGTEHPFSSYEVPVVKFYYNTATREAIHEHAELFIKYFGGSVGVLLVNMDTKEARDMFGFQGDLPAFSFQHDDTAAEHFLPARLDTDRIGRFMEENLGALPSFVDPELDGEELDEEELRLGEERAHSEGPPINIEEVERQDDLIVEVVEKTKKIKMSLDLVPALTDKSFPNIVKDSDTAVILLYFPFDPISMGNLRMFGEAADMLGQQTSLKLASVNCFDWTYICQKERITIYPTMRVFKKGQQIWDYKGPQDTRAIFSTLKLLELSPPVYETDHEKLMTFIVGKGESTLTGVTNITVVGLFRKEDKQEKEVFEQLAERSRERIMFVYTDSTEAALLAETLSTTLPAVILCKYDDEIQPYAKFDSKYTVQNLQHFVEDNKLPKLTVLTPLMFPEIRRKFSQMLILFTDDTDDCQQSRDVVREVVKVQQFNNVSFTMMPVPSPESIGFRVLREYTSEPSTPHISLVNFQKGAVFNYGVGDIDQSALTKWLSFVLEGSIQPSTMLKDEEWKPMNKGYEFLKLIEWEANERRRNWKAKADGRSGNDHNEIPDELPEEHRAASMLDGDDKVPDVDDIGDSDTRKDLFDLKDSRLYHHAPGRINHHGNQGNRKEREQGSRKERDHDSRDEGYGSDSGPTDAPTGQDEKKGDTEPANQDKSHDPSEL